MIHFQQFRWKIELPVTKWSNFQNWNLQLRSLLQTNVARPIYPHHHPCTLQPVWKRIQPPTCHNSAFYQQPGSTDLRTCRFSNV